MELRVLSGRHRGVSVSIDALPLLIGSGPDADIMLTDPTVEEQHAELIDLGPSLVLRTVNGAQVLVNQEPVPGEIQLQSGQIIRLGDVEIAVLGTRKPSASLAQEQDRQDPHLASLANQEEPVAEFVSSRSVGDGAAADEHARADISPGKGAGLRPPPVDRQKLSKSRYWMGAGGLVLAVALLGGFVMINMSPLSDVAANQKGASAAGALKIVAAPGDRAVQLREAVKAKGLDGLSIRQNYRGEVEILGVLLGARDAEVLRGLIGERPGISVSEVHSADDWVRQMHGQINDPGIKIAHLAGNQFSASGSSDKASTRSKILRLSTMWAGAIEIRDTITYKLSEDEKLGVLPKRSFPVKIAQVAGGKIPYLETVDGARFFEGSSLPDGSMIKSISVDVISLEKANKVTQYMNSD